MTQVEALWAGQCPTPWGLGGASCMGKRSVAQWMPPHTKCQVHVTGAWELAGGRPDVPGCRQCSGLHCPLANEALRLRLGPAESVPLQSGRFINSTNIYGAATMCPAVCRIKRARQTQSLPSLSLELEQKRSFRRRWELRH